MRRYLLAALWPAGVAAITAATVMALRRSAGSSPSAGLADVGAQAGAGLTAAAQKLGGESARLLQGAGYGQKAAGAIQSHLPSPRRAIPLIAQAATLSSGTGGRRPEWLPGLIKLGAISTAGGVLSYEAMVLLGRPVVSYGPRVDEPMMKWIGNHQVRKWAAVIERLNKVGNTWTTWGASGTAAACLAAAWPRHKWLPPSVLACAGLVDHYVTLALRHKFGRPGPPTSPLGTYPAGGCDRVVLFYGLVANMVWREFSGSHRGRILALGALSVLSFNQAYCRGYLSKHWPTDIVSGLVYGLVLYTPFAVAIRLIAGPPAGQAAPDDLAAVTA